ncbi:MAG: gamma-glutamyl-phosphate reductase, partial [Eubacteriales bacterium]|nr:gamma-glutamyl-phosphate reductase [Eubacteriales bacterium]
MKLESPIMAASPEDTRNKALQAIADSLQEKKDAVFEANRKDLQKAEENGISESVKKRLLFNEHKLTDVLAGIQDVIKLPDPCGRVQLKRKLDEGLILERVSCPIGVIGVIFEARPDAMIQISSLCIKSGNVAVLKGGSETKETNQALFAIIHEAAVRSGLPELCLF